MILEKINEHYENLIINFFSDYEIELSKKGLVVNNYNENIIKIHSICKTIPETLILNNIETIILFAKNKYIPDSLLLLIDRFQDKFKDTYFIDVIKEYEYFRFNIHHKRYDYKVYTFIDNSTNEDSIKEQLNNFIYKDIKLPNFVIETIFKDIEKNFINGFSINFDDYDKDIILGSSDRSDFMVVYTNKLSGKQLVVHPIQINEQTGDVFFAGKYENILKL